MTSAMAASKSKHAYAKCQLNLSRLSLMHMQISNSKGMLYAEISYSFSSGYYLQ